MAIEAAELLRLRPHAFHTTGATNLAAIRHDHAIVSTWDLLSGTPCAHLLDAFRTRSHLVVVGNHPRLIRDQRPIRPGSLSVETGSTVAEYRDSINQRVFFWPGRDNWIVGSGRKHFELYSRTEPLFVLRIPLQSLLEQNQDQPLFLARCNSGSARYNNGQPVSRGPSTFRQLHDADFRASEVVELSFLHRVALPLDTQYADSLTAEWQLLWPVV